MSGENQGAQGVTLDVGKTYVTRDGRQRFTVVEIDPEADPRHAVGAKRHGGTRCWFSPNGTFNLRPEGGDSWDLVREVQEGEALPEPKAKGSESPSQIADAQEAEPSLTPYGEALKALQTLVGDLDALIKESEGVAGLHLNGDMAPWHDLTAGGRFESWLRSLEDARAALAKAGA